MHHAPAFAGKTIVISGSSKGIGKTLAIILGKMGAQIVLNGTNSEALNATHLELQALGIDCIAVAGSVANMNDCNRVATVTIERYGEIDVVIANAGITAEGSVEESSPYIFKQLMDVNYIGTVYLVKACLRELKKSKGSILITGSASGFRGMPGAAAYSASKMALTALADALKIELFNTGVNIGLAFVGFTENDAGKTMLGADGQAIKKLSIAKGKIASQQSVALQIIRMIERRRFKQVFSALGKLNAAVVRFAPWLANMILKDYYVKNLHKKSSEELVEYPFT
jgi:dehydrogenase/reductase SDR family protein 7B